MKKRIEKDQDRAEVIPLAAALKDQGKVMRIKANEKIPKKFPIVRSFSLISQPGIGSGIGSPEHEAQILKKMQNNCTESKWDITSIRLLAFRTLSILSFY